MTIGEERRERMFKSKDCHVINGIYYYRDYEGSARVLKAEPNISFIELPESIILPNGEKLIVETIDYIAFANTDIESIVIPKSVKRLGRCAFEGCTELINVRFCGDLERIEEECFMSCTKMESIVLPSNVGRIERACFASCKSLKRFKLPLNMTCIANFMFGYCTSLTTIELPPYITGIGYCSFEGCTGLTNICFNENITSIGDEAFAYCTSLKNIEINNPNLSIGSESFRGCTSLETIILPSQDYILEESSFIGCINLKQQNALRQSEYGNYLKERWKKEQKEEKYRRLREKKWYQIWEVSQTVLIALLLVPFAIAGVILFGSFAISFGAVAQIVGLIILLGIILITIWEWITGNNVNIDIDGILNSKIIIFIILVIALILTAIILSHLF